MNRPADATGHVGYLPHLMRGMTSTSVAGHAAATAPHLRVPYAYVEAARLLLGCIVLGAVLGATYAWLRGA